GMRLGKAAELVRASVAETLAYMAFPREHWTRLRTNNPLERLNREIKRRTRVVGAFPDGESALVLVAARLRHMAGTKWGTRRYLNMDKLRAVERGGSAAEGVAGGREAGAARRSPIAGPQPRAGCLRGCRRQMCERLLTLPSHTLTGPGEPHCHRSMVVVAPSTSRQGLESIGNS